MKIKREMPEISDRMQEFADLKGGFAEIARKVGVTKETFYNMVKKKTSPSIPTLLDLADAYPDFDINYILTGKRTDPKSIEERVKKQFEVENKKLQEEVTFHRDIITNLMGKLEDVANNPFADREGASELLNSSIFTKAALEFLKKLGFTDFPSMN